jgi:hypothetical protein
MIDRAYRWRWPRRQERRFGWRVTVRFVRCMTHAGTRRLLFTARNSRVFRARLLRRFAIDLPPDLSDA